MTKIGIDARLTYYRDGGISTYIRSLITALEQLDKENDYTIFHSRKDTQRLSPTFNSESLWTPAHHKIERLALSAELAWRGLDVFHSPDFIPPYYAARKHVITVHDLTFLHYPQYLTADSRAYYNQQIETACNHADHILAVSQATKTDLINKLNVSTDKITVQPHGADPQFRPLSSDETEPVRKMLDLPSDYILHVGTWEPRKNIIALIKAYRELLSQIPDLPPIVLVGRKGWLFEQTKSDIDALDMNQHIFWRDTVSDEQLPAVYNMALVNVTVSHYEGFGMPALEGMACGIVPIVSNRSSLPEVVGDVGLQVDPDDTDTIASALQRALSDEQWRAVHSQKAIERAAQFSWQRSAVIARDTYTSVS
ncbi:MAG: glycosyltransferase family 1 protein [Phototrophicaceae bacterium]